MHRGIMTHNNMLRFVTWLGKVEIVRNKVFLVGGSEANLHVELTPSLFRDSERGVLEDCSIPCQLVGSSPNLFL